MNITERKCTVIEITSAFLVEGFQGAFPFSSWILGIELLWHNRAFACDLELTVRVAGC